MTKEEFINKWCHRWPDKEGMEFDLVSVIRQAEQDDIEALIHERYKGEDGLPETKEGVTRPVEEAKCYG